MSAIAVVPSIIAQTVAARKKHVNGKAKEKTKALPALKVRRKPNPRTRTALLNAASVLIEEGYTYREAEMLLRTFLLEKTLVVTGQNRTHAAKKLGISREHVRVYHERGKELL